MEKHKQKEMRAARGKIISIIKSMVPMLRSQCELWKWGKISRNCVFRVNLISILRPSIPMTKE